MTVSIVTGANRGIGLELVKALCKRGGTVVAACRTTSPELARTTAEVVTEVDVATPEGIARLKNAIGERPIDLLINNAGILLWGKPLGELDGDEIRKQFEVNALGPLFVTSALRERFKKGTKLGFITSRMGSIGDNGSGGQYGYRMSKAALNIAAVSIARDLAPLGVSVAVLHPGMVSTEMIGGRGQVEPDVAAQGLLARLDALTPETSGSFWHANGEVLPW
jgi:NAD(P)-dependent dehydrogenase (short-subunit alcohol dehydrogenase family)